MIAAWQIAGQTCVQVFFFRGGRNNGNRAFFPTHAKAEEAPDVLAAFIAQFYDDKPPPPCLLLNHRLPEQELVAEALSLKADRRVEILVPQRGEKRAVVQHAEINAREALERRLAESAGQAKLLEGIAQVFGLPSSARAHRGLRQQPHHGHQPIRRDDRRRPRRLHQGGVSEIRHPRADHARRRLRDDARGSAAPLHPRAQGTGGGRVTGRLARAGADRWRRRPTFGGAPGAVRTSA